MRFGEAQIALHAQRPSCVGVSQRAFDIVVASAALLLFAPLMLLIALAVLIEGGRPVLFAQQRLGEGGHPFLLYKFRKFPVRHAGGGPSVTLPNDRRLTRLGALLTKTKLDELPQLWSVLAGKMSIVGPRPEALAFADCFRDGYAAVLAFRPGIFGPNQVFLRNESALYGPHDEPEEFYRRVLFPLKARADLAYFSRRTTTRDLGWVLRGTLAVFGVAAISGRDDEILQRIEAWIRRSDIGSVTVHG